MALTQEQLAIKLHSIGSSDIPAIAGLSPWTSPMDVWLRLTGRADESPGNDQTDLGDDMEPIIGRRAAARLGLARIEKVTRTLRHPLRPYVTATPDFWAWQEGPVAPAPFESPESVLETKNVGHRVMHHWIEGEGYRAPPYVTAQVAWQLGVTGLPRGYVGALIGGRDFHVEEVPRDEELIGLLFETAERFWVDNVEGGEPPIDGSRAARDYLAQRHPELTGVVRFERDSPLLEGLFRTYAEAKAQTKAYERHADEAANRIAAIVGADRGVATPFGRATWVDLPAKRIEFERKASRHLHITTKKGA